MRFGKIISNILMLIAFSTLVFSCSEEPERETNNNKNDTTNTPEVKKEEKKKNLPKVDEYEEEKVDLGLSKDEQKFLLLFEIFPFGTPYKIIQTKLPELKDGQPESFTSQDPTKSIAKISILQHSGKLELNFRNDSLISFYYTIAEKDFTKAEKLYKGIKQFYNKKISQGKEISAEEETRDLKNCVWEEKAPFGTLNYNLNTGIISWGFQAQKPELINF